MNDDNLKDTTSLWSGTLSDQYGFRPFGCYRIQTAKDEITFVFNDRDNGKEWTKEHKRIRRICSSVEFVSGFSAEPQDQNTYNVTIGSQNASEVFEQMLLMSKNMTSQQTSNVNKQLRQTWVSVFFVMLANH